MNDFLNREIKPLSDFSGADLKPLAESLGLQLIKRSNNNYAAKCPLKEHGGPDDHPSFFILLDPESPKNGLWTCRKCSSGNFITLVMRLLNYNFRQAVMWIENKTVDILSENKIPIEKISNRINRISKSETPLYIPMPQPDGTLLKNAPAIPFSAAIINYMAITRKYGSEKAKLCWDFMLKACKEYQPIIVTEGYYDGYIITPVFDGEGKQRAFFAQSINPKNEKPKLYPYGAQIGYTFFPSINDITGDRVVIVEGLWDSVYLNAIYNIPSLCVWSSNITEQQMDLLLKHFNYISIAFDGDIDKPPEARAIRKAIEYVEMIINFGVKAKAVELQGDPDELIISQKEADGLFW